MSFAYLPLFTGDYFRDTRGLSMAGHGCYFLLLTYCWDSKGPLPLDEERIAGICEARSQEERLTMQRILRTYFTQMDDGWYQPRMQKEIERSENISRERSGAGRKGYEAKAKSLKEAAAKATAKQLLSKSQASAKQLPLPPSPNHPQERPKSIAQTPDGFERFWSEFPRKDSRKAAEKAWKALKANEALQDEILSALAKQKMLREQLKSAGEWVADFPYGASWLNGRRWEDEIELKAPRKNRVAL